MTSKEVTIETGVPVSARTGALSDLYLKEDWWAIWLGLGTVVLAVVLFSNGNYFLKALAVNPGGLKWVSADQLLAHFANNASMYLLQFVAWLVLFGVSCRVMGIKMAQFVPAFVFLYLLSLAMFGISGWVDATKYNMEAPLLALLIGLFISNFIGLPAWMDAGFRVEYFVKLGIVLLGATFPISLVATAGPVAIGQAMTISVVTCLTIFFVGTRVFGLEKRLCAVLGVGGSVCGVSGSMAIAASVGAKKEDLYTSVTLVVVWALVMVVFLPFVSQALGLSAGVAGAWIGTSEFADAAGFAAASAYGKMAGNEDAAIKAFTLMKVIGRDVWIGIWSLLFALISTMVWERKEVGAKPDAGEVWRRFPKFVIGFFVASAFMSLVTSGYSPEEFNKVVKPLLILPLNSLRTWAFIFCFLSIGLTTRFRELKSVGWKPFFAFTIGVAVNVTLGYILSVHVFGAHWSAL
ncbi:MAG: putative sulfate exporter family transporter [Rhodocyclaceae bacterium]|nr:putative sulfate exporter family transporter [Rhodocyclaceae bacterium]